jgi:type VI secretion system secreted protein VgrG
VGDCPARDNRAGAQLQRYLISSSSLNLNQDLPIQPDGSSFTCKNQLTLFPADATFRPSRVTPKPVINGVQTAIVVGPPGKSVHTDQHGRIKVRFHWIRPGHNKLTSSAWLRVAYPITHGNAPQGFAVPKIGQEVVVNFLEGDPDHPLVTGIVYKKEKKPDPRWPASATEMATPRITKP